MQRDASNQSKPKNPQRIGLFYTLEDENSFPLSQLPADVLRYMCKHFLPDAQLMVMLNRSLFNVFWPVVLRNFLLAVVHGEFAQVEGMLQRAPRILLEKLLQEKVTIQDYSGRLIEGTALQIALGANDVSLGTQCQLVSAATLFDLRYLDKLNIQSQIAYMRYDNRLFYVDKAIHRAFRHLQERHVCVEIQLDQAVLQQFDLEMQPKAEAQTLLEDQLKRITALTGHIHEEGMAEMIQRYLMRLPNGKQRIAAQIREQFPQGYELQERERAEKDLQALREVFDVVAKAGDNDDCEVALQKFRDYLKPKGVIKTGNHINCELLVHALRLYNQNYDNFGGYNSHKNNLCWTKILGYIELFLPASYAAAVWQDNGGLVHGKKLKRDDIKFFFLPHKDPEFRLGYEFAAIQGARAKSDWWGCPGTALVEYWETMLRKKNLNLERFYALADNSVQNRCVLK